MLFAFRTLRKVCAKGEAVMKKAVRNSSITGTRGTSAAIQVASSSSVASPSVKQLAGDPHPRAASPTPVWTRYVDSRLKQFCLR